MTIDNISEVIIDVRSQFIDHSTYRAHTFHCNGLENRLRFNRSIARGSFVVIDYILSSLEQPRMLM